MIYDFIMLTREREVKQPAVMQVFHFYIILIAKILITTRYINVLFRYMSGNNSSLSVREQTQNALKTERKYKTDRQIVNSCLSSINMFSIIFFNYIVIN